jgi:hypothetical protein
MWTKCARCNVTPMWWPKGFTAVCFKCVDGPKQLLVHKPSELNPYLKYGQEERPWGCESCGEPIRWLPSVYALTTWWAMQPDVKDYWYTGLIYDQRHEAHCKSRPTQPR